MSTIDTSGIDATKPILGNPTTQSVRDNFAEIIIQLNNASSDIDMVGALDAVLAGMEGVTINANEIHYATGLNTYDVTALTPWARANLLASTGNLNNVGTVQGVNGSGTDVAGTNVIIAGGQGTGAGAGGSILLQVAESGVSGSTPNALATAVTIDENLNVGLGVTPRADLWAQGTWLGIGSATYLTGPDYLGGNHWLDTSVNAYFSDTWRYVDTGEATIFELYNGSWWMARAASGVADGVITWETTWNIYESGGVTRVQGSVIDNDTAMAGASIYKLATQYAIKTYIDNHATDSTIHFTEASIDHTAIANIGTNTHAQIDTHIADTTNLHQWTTSGTDIYYDGGDFVGIGVAPNAGWNHYDALTVGVSGAIAADSSGAYMVSGAYAFGNNAFRYITTGLAVAMYKQDSGGDHNFYSAPSGTAGGTVSQSLILSLGRDGHFGFNAIPEGNWDTAVTALELAGNATIWTTESAAAGGSFTVGHNTYDHVSLGEVYKITDEASKYHQINGTHVFSVAVSGTIDTAISWTTALTIDNGGHTILPQVNDAATPTLAFGDGDTGFYESADDNLYISIAGVAHWIIAADYFRGLNSSGPIIYDRAPTSVNPNIIPNIGDTNTGIGWAGDDQLSLITGGVERMRLGAAGGVFVREVAAAEADVAAYGQVWVKNDIPNTLWFTDDAGTDFQIGGTGLSSSPWTTVGSDIYYNTGHVAVGNAAPETWTAGYSAFQLGGTAALASNTAQTAGAGLLIGQNMYLNAGYKYIVTDEASMYYQNSGVHTFYVATSGTFDTAISWTTAFTINNDGSALLDGIKIVGNSGAGTDSMAIGVQSPVADANYSLAIGDTAAARGQYTIAIGRDNFAYETNCISLGRSTQTGQAAAGFTEISAIAIGYNAKAYETNAIAIGASAVASKTGSTADPDAIAIGSSTLSDGDGSIAIGVAAQARNDNTVALGDNADARETADVAIGYNSQAGNTAGAGLESYATAIGGNSFAYEANTIAIGGGRAGKSGLTASPAAISIGSGSFADQLNSTAVGVSSEARGTSSLALGDAADARDAYNISIGVNSQTGQTDNAFTAQSALAIGNSAVAYETSGIAIGNTAVSGKNGTNVDPYTIAIGATSTANEAQAVAIGYQTEARGTDSLAIGRAADARESDTIAFGAGSRAGQADGGTAETNAMAIGTNSRAYNNLSVAIGNAAAAGTDLSAVEEGSIAIGASASSTKLNTVAIGKNAQATVDYGVSIGHQAYAWETNGVAIGRDSRAGDTTGANTEINAIAIGNGAVARDKGSIAIGAGAITTTANQGLIGGSTESITQFVVGNGMNSGTPAAVTIQNTPAGGTNIAGADLTILAGPSTGSANGGDLIFQVTPAGAGGTGANTPINALVIEGISGQVGIGVDAPGADLEIRDTASPDLMLTYDETAVLSAERLGRIQFNSLDTNWSGVKAAIWVEANQNITGIGGDAFDMVFEVNEFTNGAVEALRLSGEGNVVLGEAALGTTATDGFLYIPTCAGAPTGTPTSYTGRVALVFDTTNNNLYVYDGSWISVALA